MVIRIAFALTVITATQGAAQNTYNCRDAIAGSAAEENEKVNEPGLGIKIRLYRDKDWRTTYLNGGWLSWIANQNAIAAKSYPVGARQNACLYLTKLAGANQYEAGLVYDGGNQIAYPYTKVVVCEKAHDHKKDVKPKRVDLDSQCNDKNAKLHISFAVNGSPDAVTVERPAGGWTRPAIVNALKGKSVNDADAVQIAAGVLAVGDWYPCGANRCCKVFA